MSRDSEDRDDVKGCLRQSGCLYMVETWESMSSTSLVTYLSRFLPSRQAEGGCYEENRLVANLMLAYDVINFSGSKILIALLYIVFYNPASSFNVSVLMYEKMRVVSSVIAND